jgi:hypothetical protein
MQRMGCHAAFALIATALFSLPGFAAEPGGPANLITQIESVRITVEDRLSSGSPPSSLRKSEQDALINYYGVASKAFGTARMPARPCLVRSLRLLDCNVGGGVNAHGLRPCE